MKKSFWSKPITWGGYAKLSIISSIVGMTIGAIYYICEFTMIPENIVSWFKSKFHKETEYEEVE